MQQILAHLEAQREPFLADLAPLVNLDCGTHNKSGVDRAGDLMRACMVRFGLTVETTRVERYGDFLTGRVRGRGDARILLIGHLDTVYPDGTAAERPMAIHDGYIVGPGANDMKAGLLAGAYAIGALLSVGFHDFAEIAFFCNSEEETGSPVSAAEIARLARDADACFVLEAARADGSVVSARKGGARFRFEVTGRSAHAGVEPEKGASAVHEMAHHIVALQSLSGLRPGTTVNVGVVRGGTRANVVADACDAEVDVRVTTSDDVEPVETAVRSVVASTHVPGTTTRLITRGWKHPMDRTPGIDRLVSLARGIAAELGFDLGDVATGGMSDANTVARVGTPVLDGLGPVGGRCHSPDEYVELDSIVPRTALLAGLVRATCVSVQSLRAFSEEARRR